MSWFSRYLSGFPPYDGRYTVGSASYELPASSLESPAPTPDSDITTVSFRIFYPCDPSGTEPAVRWLDSPQRGYVTAFAKFMGAGNVFSSLFSYVIPSAELSSLTDPLTGIFHMLSISPASPSSAMPLHYRRTHPHRSGQSSSSLTDSPATRTLTRTFVAHWQAMAWL